MHVSVVSCDVNVTEKKIVKKPLKIILRRGGGMEQLNEPRDCSTHVQSSLKESFIGAPFHWAGNSTAFEKNEPAEPFIVRRISRMSLLLHQMSISMAFSVPMKIMCRNIFIYFLSSLLM